MAKSIKAIKCPNCGSVKKTEIKPDYFVCTNCDTEYFLDNDDINVNVKHIPNPTSNNQTPDLKKRIPLFIFGALVLIIFVAYLLPNSAQRQGSTIVEKEKYDYSTSADFVFANPKTNEAVLLRIARENIREKDGSYDYVNTHAVFIDPISKKIIKDVVLFNHIRRLDSYDVRFYVASNGTIYMIYYGPIIYRLDRENNQLIDCTKTIFQKHPELSAGVAKADAYQDNDYWNILSNDGVKYYYYPAEDILTQDYKVEDKIAQTSKMDKPFVIKDQTTLLKRMAVYDDGSEKTIELSPNKKLFDADINYQDKASLIINTKATASDASPTMLQRIDVNTGATVWSLPAKSMFYENMVKCTQGYAVRYSSGESLDYISGVFIISPEGKILHDYMIGRNE